MRREVPSLTKEGTLRFTTIHSEFLDLRSSEFPCTAPRCEISKPPLVRSHNVRLNSSVAAVIVTAANATRYIRSNVMAPNPVFFSIKLFSACTM